jgi:TPR repeat protein
MMVAQVVAAPAVTAFEGDYIWDERFKQSLARAQSGQAKDQYTVGDMYLRGRGTRIDPTKALHWFLLAAKQGHSRAAYKAGYLYLHSEKYEQATPQSPAAALPLLHQAAEAGFPPAMYELGLVYGNGIAGYWDSAQALNWFGKARQAGYEPAKAEFAALVRRLVKSNTAAPTQVARAERRLVPKAAPRELLDPRRIIMRSQWKGANGPSALLPSPITRCRKQGADIECLSTTRTMQLESAQVIYRTRTRITDINTDGQFRLSYANNVLSAEAEESRASIGIKTGWQQNEHTLHCSLVAGRTISCAQGPDKMVRYVGH